MTAHRQIHIDFHTPAGVTVGDKFNAVEFFDTLESAMVNSIAIFAKCHHGYSYFDTKVGTRHPGLSFDMLGQAVAEAASLQRGCSVLAPCHRQKSAAPFYVNYISEQRLTSEMSIFRRRCPLFDYECRCFWTEDEVD
ncbi:MAG: hypothetical protein NTV93_09315 [Verrucomicrobia bacterium]|nr:hypothetical protein [Verrucomicrobiota bacterium]